MIGLITADSGRSAKQVAPFGGREARIGTNPLSIAIPSDLDGPLFLDMATSAVAAGKISLAVSRGEPIPLGWIVDRDGKPTTDPEATPPGRRAAAAGRQRGLQGQRPGGHRRDPVRAADGPRLRHRADRPPQRRLLHRRLQRGRLPPAGRSSSSEVAEFARYLKATPPVRGQPRRALPGRDRAPARAGAPPRTASTSKTPPGKSCVARRRLRADRRARARPEPRCSSRRPPGGPARGCRAASRPRSRCGTARAAAARARRSSRSRRSRPGTCVAATTKPSHTRSANSSSSASATSFGPPTMASSGRPRWLKSMNSRTVGLALPLSVSTRSRIVCMPEKLASSSSVNGSSRPFEAKSKFSASDSSDSWSISSGSCWTSAILSSASALRRGAHRRTRLQMHHARPGRGPPARPRP